MKFSNLSRATRKWSRILHRDLSFIFSGMLIIYAVSGIVMNHEDTMSTDYSVAIEEFTIASLPPKADIDKAYVEQLLTPLDQHESYTKHYFPGDTLLKVFIKGGSSLVVDLKTKKAIHERLTPKPVISFMANLHYNNPGGWWTHFSDLFALSLIIIVITGLVMNKGKNGLMGRGGIELILGMIIPLLTLL